MNRNYLNIAPKYNHNYLLKNKSFDLNQIMKGYSLVNILVKHSKILKANIQLNQLNFNKIKKE